MTSARPTSHIPQSHDYRIECRDTLSGRLLPSGALNHLYANPSLAVAVAVKSVADPTRQQVRVVHVPSGEIVFQSTGPAPLERL